MAKPEFQESPDQQEGDLYCAERERLINQLWRMTERIVAASEEVTRRSHGTEYVLAHCVKEECRAVQKEIDGLRGERVQPKASHGRGSA